VEEYDLIRDVFLGHFPDRETPAGPPVMRRRVSEVRGYFIRSRIPQDEEA
jgi:hypothetical protein